MSDSSGSDEIMSTPPENLEKAQAATHNLLPLKSKERPHLLETENKENKTPLVQAIDVGDVQMLQLLISLGCNVNRALFYNKRTPLMVAVYEGQLQIASILMDKGSDESARDINGLNILHYAVDSNRKESVQFCLKIMKDFNCQDNNGWTALMRAEILGISDEIIDLLLEKGADKNLRDRNGLDFYYHRKLKLNLGEYDKQTSTKFFKGI